MSSSTQRRLQDPSRAPATTAPQAVLSALQIRILQSLSARSAPNLVELGCGPASELYGEVVWLTGAGYVTHQKTGRLAGCYAITPLGKTRLACTLALH